MSEQASKSSKAASKPDDSGAPQNAPGPITKEHESGTSEQTLAANELRDKMRVAQGGKSAEEIEKLREDPRARKS